MRQALKKTQSVIGNGACAFVVSLPVLLAVSPTWAEQSGPIVYTTTASGADSYTVKHQASGEINVQGSNTLYPLMIRLAAEFRRVQPQVVIGVKGEGSAKSLAEFLRGPQPGQITLKEERKFPPIITSSRELFDAERKEFVESHGYEPTEIPVAVDAVAIYVHKDNPLQALTLAQVDAIFSKSHLRGYQASIREWSQLGLRDGDGWVASSMHLYGRDRRSGTYGFFQVHALAGGEFAETLHESPGAASVIMSVGRDPMGIGYSGLGLQSSNVRVIPLAESEGMLAVLPSATTVANETYPLRRVLYLYIDKDPKKDLPVTLQEFLRFMASDQGQQAVLKAGFFPLPSSEVLRPVASSIQ